MPENTRPVEINGYTQSGSDTNTQMIGDNAIINIELDGQNAGAGGEGIRLAADNSLVRGLAVYRFGVSSVTVGAGTSGSRVQGNFIGVNASGAENLRNGFGVILSTNASNSIIGTNGDGMSDLAEQNIISGSTFSGVSIQSGANNVVAGNYIGTNAAASFALRNDIGVLISGGANNTRIGTDANGTSDDIKRNIISGNVKGVVLQDIGTINNIIAGNYIGVDVLGSASLANNDNAVLIKNGAANNTVGGANAARRNTINSAANGGVRIEGATSGNNSIVGNYIGIGADGANLIRAA